MKIQGLILSMEIKIPDVSGKIFETCFKKRCWWRTDGPGLPSIFMSALISLCLPLGNSAFINLPGHQIEQSGALCHSSVAVEIGESM